jgi:hypothetical protein
MLQRELASIHRQVGQDSSLPSRTTNDYDFSDQAGGDERMQLCNVLVTCRCDLTLVCSPVELEVLRDHYGVPGDKLVLAPFFVPPVQAQQLPAYAARSHFVSIGNFKHPPNLDSVRLLVACSPVSSCLVTVHLAADSYAQGASV